MQAERFSIHKQTFWLSSERCIFWEEQKALVVSDLHFGKTGHFRKSGIAVPQNIYKEDLQRLVSLVQYYRPEQLIVVGDMFHSKENKEIDFFVKWRKDLSQLEVRLVKGNHDILKTEMYKSADISVSDVNLSIDNICFVHDITEACTDPEIDYYISGHIHPCVKLNGLGKQSISLPCYYFTKEFAVLPAFSKFTGTAHIEPKASDSVFAIIGANMVKGQRAAVVKV